MKLKRVLWSLRRALGLSPTQWVFRELRGRGVRLPGLAALEVFGGSGHFHTKDYAFRVARLDIWEIDAANGPALRRAFPGAEVTIADSYEQMKRTGRKYDLLVIDNPEGAHGGHYEHYDLFPAILGLATDSAVVITTVRPGSGFSPKDPCDTFDEAHLARRRAFYRTEHPERMGLEEMIPAYRELIQAGGFELEWYFFRQRTLSGRLHYLVLKLHRQRPASSLPSGPCGR